MFFRVQEVVCVSCSNWFTLTSMGLGTCCTHRGFASQLSNPQFRRCESCTVDCKQASPALEGDFVSILWGSAVQTSFKKKWNKSSQWVPQLARGTEMWEIRGEAFLNSHSFCLLLGIRPTMVTRNRVTSELSMVMAQAELHVALTGPWVLEVLG
jgi:hypothetical protein